MSSALPAPFDVTPPVGASDRQIWYAILNSLAGSGGSSAYIQNISENSTLSAPAANAAAVTPGASALANPSRAVFVGTGGNLNVTMVGGQTTLFTNVPDGTTLPIRVTHILATSTDADNIVTLW